MLDYLVHDEHGTVEVTFTELRTILKAGIEKSSKFVPPGIEHVLYYANEKGLAINAKRFVDYYEARGWMMGKTKMKDWKAAVRQWANKDHVVVAPWQPNEEGRL